VIFEAMDWGADEDSIPRARSRCGRICQRGPRTEIVNIQGPSSPEGSPGAAAGWMRRVATESLETDPERRRDAKAPPGPDTGADLPWRKGLRLGLEMAKMLANGSEVMLERASHPKAGQWEIKERRSGMNEGMALAAFCRVTFHCRLADWPGPRAAPPRQNAVAGLFML